MLPPLSIQCLTEQQAELICSWRYLAPYDLFNWPNWSVMQQEAMDFGDPEIRMQQYIAILDKQDHFVGYAQLFPLEGVTRLGIGLRPDLCGKGYGHLLVRTIAEEARRRKPHHEIDLEVLTWNARAIASYAKSGFAVTDTYERMTPTGLAEFHCMVFMG